MKKEGIRGKDDFRCQFNVQAASLSRRIFKKHGIEVKSLYPLKDIYLVIMGREKAISKIGPDQQSVIDSLGLELEV